MTEHKVSGHFLGGMSFEAKHDDQVVRMDAAEDVGGSNSGFRPKPLMLSSLIGCTGMDIVSLLNKMRVEFSNFDMEVSADLSDEHPKQYTEIRLTYKIRVQEGDQVKVLKAISLSQEKYCGVSAMLSKICPVKWEINYV